MNLIIILGNNLPKNGYLNKILQNRLDKGKELYHDSLIIVSRTRSKRMYT